MKPDPLEPLKRRVLDALDAAGKPLSVAELLDRLGRRHTPKLVRAALAHLIESGEVARSTRPRRPLHGGASRSRYAVFAPVESPPWIREGSS